MAILSLLLGYLLSLYFVPTPQVAVIRVEGDLWGEYPTYLGEALEAVEQDRSVRAVVLSIVSPGGEVTASEELYFEVLKLRARKPVVASVDELATSGAYYLACAADQIYAKPASSVGNIGVVSILPEPDLVDEKLITTGPFKFSGGPQVDLIRQMEMLKESFLAAVLAQRGDRLQVGKEVLSRGEVYLGIQAQQMGLVDEIGSQGEAIAAAARLARLRHYQVVDRSPELPEEPLLLEFELEGTMTAHTAAAPPDDLPPGFYYRYLEPPW
ncbi:MAG: S49 family peptidase [Anaerolineae bacterium]